MTKTLRLLFLTVFSVLCGNTFAQETTVTWLASSGDALTTIYPDANISLKWEEGAGDQAPKYSNGSVYFYNGNRLNVAGVTNDVVIKKVVFTFADNSKVGMSTCDKSGKNVSNTGIANDNDNLTTTWTGESGSIYFRASANTGVRNISSIEVTYTGGTTTPVETAPVLAITQDNIADTYDMDKNDVFVVYYKNEGNAAAENAKLTLFVDGQENAAKEIGTLAIGVSDFWNAKYDVTNLEAGEHQVYLSLTADNAEAVTTEAKTVTFTKADPVVEGAEISINPIRGWEVEAGEQTVTVTVSVFNNGTAEAKDVKVELYKSYGDGLCDAQTVDVPVGEVNYKVLTFTFNYTFETGKSYEFTAFTNFNDADLNNQMQTFTLTCPAAVANVTVAKIAPITVTTEDDVVISAVLKNNSDVAAEDVKVGVYNIVDLQYQLVGAQLTINEIAAGEQSNVEFNLGKLAAGSYKYYVIANGTSSQEVEVTVTEPAQDVIDMAIIAVQGSSEINLQGTNTYKVWYKNEGNVTVENAEIILLVDGENEAGRQVVTVEPGQQGSVEFTLDVADFDPTEDIDREVILLGFVNVDGDVNAENNKSSMTATVVSKAEVAEPTLTITAQDVEVEFGAEKFDVTATITSDIDAENVEVKLFYNQTIATQTVSFVAGEPTTVTFADVENPFTKAGEYTMYVMAAKALAEVKVTVKPEAVAETIDMAVIAIQGLSQVNLQGENKVVVWYENMGTKDLENVAILFSVNESPVDEPQTVNVKAGASGYVEYTIDLADIEAAEETEVILEAWVNVDGDVDATNNKVTKTLPIVNGETAEPTFSVTAADVTVSFGDASFDIVATVKNTSDVDAQGLTVKLLKGITEVETMTLNEVLAAGAETTVTFTINAPEEGFQAGKAYYYVQAGNAQAAVEVTFEAQPAVKTIDMAITAIQGLTKIDLSKENKVTVWYENKGEQDLENVAIMFSVNDHAQEQSVNVKSGRNGYVTFTIDPADFEPSEDVEAELIAWVNVEGDIDNTNDRLTRTVPVIAGEAVLSKTVLDVFAEKDAESFDVVVKVLNSGAVEAKDVLVSVYDASGSLLASETIETIAAGEEEEAVVTIHKTYTEVGVYRNELQVVVAGVEGATWKSVTVVADITSIAAVKAQLEKGAVYTISGAKVNTIKKGGVYVVNGRKVIVK